MPSGEVFTGPVETSARAWSGSRYRRRRAACRSRGSSWSSATAVVISARADRGDDVLQAMLATDDGARRLGEIGIGTNFGIDRAVGMTLLDEKIGGTVHLALGRSYPETGGTNESAIHWDMICDLRARRPPDRRRRGDPRERPTSGWVKGANFGLCRLDVGYVDLG